MLLGRWHAAKTARIYINEGLAILANLTLKWNPTNRHYRRIYISTLSKPLPRLEPTLKGKQGGRGKKVQKPKLKSKRAKKERMQICGHLHQSSSVKEHTQTFFQDGAIVISAWRNNGGDPGLLARATYGLAWFALGGPLTGTEQSHGGFRTDGSETP